MRRRTLVGIGLVILVIEVAARPFFRLPGIPSDPAARVDAGARVPPPVLSTLRRACFDCHSDDTRWPWYSALPGAFWLVRNDVSRGRGQLNFSRWNQYNRFDRADLLDKVCEKATSRDMPLWQYRLLHPEARLGDPDVAALCAWTRQEAARLSGDGS